MESNQPPQHSFADTDPTIKRLFEWIVAEGGVVNCEARIDKLTNVRGLYASKDFNSDKDIIIKIPGHLIVSPYHVSALPFHGSRKDASNSSQNYGQIYKLSDELFDSKHPFEPSLDMPDKLENSLAEYF